MKPAIVAAVSLFGLCLSIHAQDQLAIGIGWPGKSGMADAVAKGFEKKLQQIAPQIAIESKKGVEQKADFEALAKKWCAEKKAVVFLRSQGAEWLMANPPGVPAFIGACNDPSQIGVVKNMAAPEGMITGVTYALPLEKQIETFKTIIPGLKSLLLIVEKGHPSAPIEQKGIKKACETYGIAYSDKVCESKEEAVAAAKEAAGKTGAILIGSQAKIMDNAKEMIEAAPSTPFFSFSQKPVLAGALGGFVADDEKLGALLAESVADVLVKKRKISEVPVKFDPEPLFYLNAKSMQRLNIDVPADILSTAKIVE